MSDATVMYHITRAENWPAGLLCGLAGCLLAVENDTVSRKTGDVAYPEEK